MRIVTLFLIFALLLGPVSATTNEAQVKGFWQETDITFWQTLPFAVFWCHFADRQVASLVGSALPVNWGVIFAVSAAISLSNGMLQANKVMKSERARSN